MIIKVVIDEYSDFPQYKNQTTFQIINGRKELPALQIPKEVVFNKYIWSKRFTRRIQDFET